MCSERPHRVVTSGRQISIHYLRRVVAVRTGEKM